MGIYGYVLSCAKGFTNSHPLKHVLLLFGGGDLHFTGVKTGLERERDLLKVTQPCQGWNEVALTFHLQGEEWGISTGARESCS